MSWMISVAKTSFGLCLENGSGGGISDKNKLFARLLQISSQTRVRDNGGGDKNNSTYGLNYFVDRVIYLNLIVMERELNGVLDLEI